MNTSWFREISELWPGQSFSLKYKKTLLEKKSKYQKIVIYESINYGKVLTLDGIIQLTEKDEFSYHEMITHLPLFAHKAPENVLIIGGGDGMVIREVVKHTMIKTIILCEIDKLIIDTCKTHFPLQSWNDSRLKLVCEDAYDFIKKGVDLHSMDVIICDSSDPIGPAKKLFTKIFYVNLKKCLKKDGIFCFQAECMWINLKFIKRIMSICKELFKYVSYATISIPSYPCGQIGIIICSDREVKEKVREEKFEKELKYYSGDMHRASFILPRFFYK